MKIKSKSKGGIKLDLNSKETQILYDILVCTGYKESMPIKEYNKGKTKKYDVNDLCEITIFITNVLEDKGVFPHIRTLV